MTTIRWDERVARAVRHMHEARRQLDAACEQLSDVRGMAARWEQLGMQSTRVQEFAQRLERDAEKRRASLEKLNPQPMLEHLERVNISPEDVGKAVERAIERGRQ